MKKPSLIDVPKLIAHVQLRGLVDHRGMAVRPTAAKALMLAVWSIDGGAFRCREVAAYAGCDHNYACRVLKALAANDLLIRKGSPRRGRSKFHPHATYTVNTPHLVALVAGVKSLAEAA